MDITYIIVALIAAAIAAAITYFLLKGKQEPQEAMQESSVGNQLEEHITTLTQQKEKAEKLLAEANEKNKELSHQLKTAVDGGQVSPEMLSQLADTEKLKKKIKQLEGEIEDYEDDLDDAKKKLKNKIADCEQFQEEKRKAEKNLKDATTQLEETRTQLEIKTQELSLKMESLSFVQTILSAPETRDSQTSSLYSKVNSLVSFIDGDLLDTLKAFSPKKLGEAKKLFTEELKRWEAVQKKSWIANKTSIAFVGEFSAGKTSIVNRILSQDDPSVPRLPVSTKATTAIPTYISGDVKTYYRFFTQDNKLKEIPASDFNRVTKEVLDQVGGVSNLIRYFVMSYKNPNLDNLSILDTPGFNSNDNEDSERTLEVINECDALFWVFDVNAGTVNKSSINLIKANLHKPLYVIINKVDTKADSEVTKVEKLIKDTFEREGVSVEGYLRFSSKAPLDSIMNPVKSIKTYARAGAYLDAIKNFMKDVKKNADAKVKECNEKYRQCNSDFEEAIETFDNTCNTLQENCIYAANILENSWTEQGFSALWGNEDKYELSKEDGGELKETLVDVIADNNVGVVRNNCELISELSKKLQEAYSDLAESREQLQQLQRADERLRQNINNLKR